MKVKLKVNMENTVSILTIERSSVQAWSEGAVRRGGCKGPEVHLCQSCKRSLMLRVSEVWDPVPLVVIILGGLHRDFVYESYSYRVKN